MEDICVFHYLKQQELFNCLASAIGHNVCLGKYLFDYHNMNTASVRIIPRCHDTQVNKKLARETGMVVQNCNRIGLNSTNS